MRPHNIVSFRGLQLLKGCLVFVTISSALAGTPVTETETIGQQALRRSAVPPLSPMFVEAILVEKNVLPPPEGRPAFSSTELVLKEAVRLGTRRQIPFSSPESVEMSCRLPTDPVLESLEPGEFVVLHTRPSFPESWLGLSGLWFLTTGTNCEDPRSGDYPMTCKIIERCDRCAGECQPRGMAFPGRPTRPASGCENRRHSPNEIDSPIGAQPGQARRTREREPVTVARKPTTPTRAPAPASAAPPPGPGTRQNTQGDFDEDGVVDLAIISARTPAVRILLGEGEERFRHAGEIAVGHIPTAVATGDLNGDGHLDLVVTRSADGVVVTFLGNGEGAFEQKSQVTLPRIAYAVTIGEFEGDPALDVVVAFCDSRDYLGDALTLLVGDGEGNLATMGHPSAKMGTLSLAIADINADGDADLLVLNPDGGVLEAYTSERTEPGP